MFIYFGCYKWLKKVQKTENEISEANRIKIESEAKIKFFANIPPMNDRINNNFDDLI